jgi:hypothetical protein
MLNDHTEALLFVWAAAIAFAGLRPRESVEKTRTAAKPLGGLERS